ncbi:Hypothetical protein KP2612_002004 [Komagataella phaffii]|uniref:Nucleolar protein Dnt1-like N-terminal domain-containing protein n=2 Tax=Komagataella phaffii TaxID=460519 RepID=C4R275_KOMPG|nr:Hypothetical protein PAS_chr2-2_0307 [Komagataella phaffii GS115]CAH2447852.1 hypothetical protein BQ9382_C2-1780 [Komagataella phaffii CBS 7435]CAY69599.1 Hypothetical protein PAS_chr2-2_0307 [Komagataella phaffii GS115]
MSKLQLEVRIIPPSVRELEDQILTQSYLIPREPVQNPNSSFSLSLQSTSVSPQPLYQYPINLHPNVVRFVHLTLFSNTLNTIAEEISQRFLKLHPDQDPLEIERLENSFGTDLDPDYVAEDIFNRDNLIRVIVDKEIVTRKRSQSPQPFHNSLILPRKRAKSSSLKTPNPNLQSPSRHPLAEEINANSTTLFANVDPTKPNSPATSSTPVILNNSTRKVSERITSGMLTADMPNLSNNDIPSADESSYQKGSEPKQASVPSKETVQMNKKTNTMESSVTTSPNKVSSSKVAEKSPSPTGENTVTLTKEDVFRFFKSGIRNSTGNDTDLEDTFSSYKPARFNPNKQNGSGLAIDEAPSSRNRQHSALEPEQSSTLTESSAPKVVTALASSTNQPPRLLRSINANSKVANALANKEQFEESQEKDPSSLAKDELSKQKAAEEETSRRRQAEERRRLQEEKRQLQYEEKLRKDEARRLAREERDRSRLEKKAQQEEEKLKRQEERKKLQEEKKKQLEEEKQRKLEEKRKLSEMKSSEEISQSHNSQSPFTSPARQSTVQTASSPASKIMNDPARNTGHNSLNSPVTNNIVKSSANPLNAVDTLGTSSTSPVKKPISPTKVNPSSTNSLATVSTSSLDKNANRNQPSARTSDNNVTNAPLLISRRNVTELSPNHPKVSSENLSSKKVIADKDQEESSSESDSTSDSSDNSESDSDSNSETDTSSDSDTEGSGSEEEKHEKKSGTVSKRPIVVNTPATKTVATSSKPTLQASSSADSSRTPVKNQNSSSSASPKKADISVLQVEKKEPALTGVSSLPKLTQLMERGVPAVKDTTNNLSSSNKKLTPHRRVKSDAIVDDSDLSSSSSSDSTSSSDSDSSSSSGSDSSSGNNSSSDDSSDSASESDGNKALSSQFLNSKKAKELIGKKKKSSALSSLLKDTKK